MSLTVWNRAMGTLQGRLVPRGFVPPEGSFAFVLGCDLPGFTGRVEVGDFVEVRQQASFGEAKLLRLRAQLRPPTTVPAGILWRFAIRIDGVERVAAMLMPGRTRDRLDLAVNVSKLTGEHELALRLALAAG